jgi:splicing factor 3B subunit 4
MMAQNRHWEQDKEATIYVGNIDERVPKSVIYEIALQMGPILNLYMPLDRISQHHQGYGFVEFRTPADAEYAAQVLNGIKLYGKSLRANKASADKHRATDVGAELFVGNLDPMVDEKVLYDTFSRFGPLLAPPKVAREESGQSKGYGFISYADFESSDAAMANMHGQYLLSKEVSIDYAFKRDGKGEKHGDEAERKLAAQAKKRNIVPESQPLPAAFLASHTPQQPHLHQPPAAGMPPGAPPGFDPSLMAQGHHAYPQSMMMPQAASPGMPSMSTMPPSMPPGFMPPRGPSPHHYNAGGMMPPQMGGGGRAVAQPLPPAPSGLPARPPQAPGGYNNPADFHPGGFRSPANGPTPPSPHGFSAGPPPGFPGAHAPPGGPPAPPPGFMPPPGFAPPGFPAQR